MSISRAEARLIAAQTRRTRSARGAAVAGTRRSAVANAALVMAARDVRRQEMRAIRGHNRAVALSNPRLLEHKTFDATAAPVVIANCFSNNGAVAGTPFAPVAATSAWCLNQVPLGNSSITRVGRRFANTALAVRAQITPGTTGTLAGCALILVWDRNPNQGAAIPPFTSVLATQNNVALTNKDNAPRFKILRRWAYTVAGNFTAGQLTDKSIYYIDEFVKMKNKVSLLTSADTTGLLPDFVEGSLLLYAVGDSNNAAGTTCPTLTIMTRLYFQDS